MDVIDAIRNRRAVRKFSGQPVPDEVLHAILSAGGRSQSSKNDWSVRCYCCPSAWIASAQAIRTP